MGKASITIISTAGRSYANASPVFLVDFQLFRIPSSIMHGHTLPPALIPPAFHSPSMSPSEQISRFLGIDVQLVQVSPFKTDERVCRPPPGVGEKAEWEEEVQEDKVKGEGEVVTGFADGYPLLIANEGEFPARDLVKAVVQHVDSLVRLWPRYSLVSSGSNLDSGLGIRRTSFWVDQPRSDVR